MKPHEAYNKALKAGKRMPELEHIILTDPAEACIYAIYLVKSRWEIAEDIIMTDPRETYHYARHVIKDKLPTKMHNRMLLYAMKTKTNLSCQKVYIGESSYYVKSYFEFLERRENIKKLTVDQLYDKLINSKDFNEFQQTIRDAAERMIELSDDCIRNLINKYQYVNEMNKNGLATGKEIKYLGPRAV